MKPPRLEPDGGCYQRRSIPLEIPVALLRVGVLWLNQ